MNKVLTAAAVDRLRRDGFHFPIPCISKTEAADCRRQVEAFEAANGGALTGAHRFKTHLLFKWLADLVRAPQVLDAVEDLIGPDILCWTTHWFIKEPRSPQYVSWHQDSNYWGLETKDLVSVWVALSPATVESGCMRLLPGSHLGPPMPHVDTYAEDNILTRGQTILDVDESRAVNVELETGDAALFAYEIAHASHPNRSDDRRIAVVLRYMPPSARQTLADWGQRGPRPRGGPVRPLRARAGAVPRPRPGRGRLPPQGGRAAAPDLLPGHRLAGHPGVPGRGQRAVLTVPARSAHLGPRRGRRPDWIGWPAGAGGGRARRKGKGDGAVFDSSPAGGGGARRRGTR